MIVYGGGSGIEHVVGTGNAGSTGDGGLAISALLSNPKGLAMDKSGNLYIADSANNKIRLLTVSSSIITTVAGSGSLGYLGDGGAATSASLNIPGAVAVDASGNVYIADTYSYAVRLVTRATGIITTLAGNGLQGSVGYTGMATDAKLGVPQAVAVDAQGNVYIADGNGLVQVVTQSTQDITTLAGNVSVKSVGIPDNTAGTAASFLGLGGIAVDGEGSVYVSDSNHSVYKIFGGLVTRYAGTRVGFSGDGGLARNAQLSSPKALAVDAAGNLFISDTGNKAIREVTALYTMSPTGPPTDQPSLQPTGQPSNEPSTQPTQQPTQQPTRQPTAQPTHQPTLQPTSKPSKLPTMVRPTSALHLHLVSSCRLLTFLVISFLPGHHHDAHACGIVFCVGRRVGQRRQCVLRAQRRQPGEGAVQSDEQRLGRGGHGHGWERRRRRARHERAAVVAIGHRRRHVGHAVHRRRDEQQDPRVG